MERRRAKRQRSYDSERGASLVEASIAIAVAILIVMGTIDLMRIGFRLEAAQHVVNEAARWASIGQSLPSAPSRTAALKLKVQELAAKMGLDVSPAQVAVCSLVVEACFPESSLEAGELFSLRLEVPITLVSLLGYTTNFVVEAIDQSEPY